MRFARITLAAGILALSASSLAMPAFAGNTSQPTRRSFQQPCAEIARTPAQMAHLTGTNPSDWTQYGPCRVSYDGPKIPKFTAGKDEIVRDNGCACGAIPLVGQFGDLVKFSNSITIRTLNSKEGRFVRGLAPKVKWSQLEDYIRRAGKSQGISYWAGEFWSSNDDTRPHKDISYSGPARKWVVPDGAVVVTKSGRRYSAGYEVKLAEFTIVSDWYVY